MKLPKRVFIEIPSADDFESMEYLNAWFENNREMIHITSLDACWQFVKNPGLALITIFEIFEKPEDPDMQADLLAFIDIGIDDAIKNLEETESYFVSIENYESAASAVECRKQIELLNKNDYE
jgi:hypothetical protein